jgi:hypothetical protein
MYELSGEEFQGLWSKISTTKLTKTRVPPKAFTEKGLYMIATILKSRQAMEATFAIIETFARAYLDPVRFGADLHPRPTAS